MISPIIIDLSTYIMIIKIIDSSFNYRIANIGYTEALIFDSFIINVIKHNLSYATNGMNRDLYVIKFNENDINGLLANSSNAILEYNSSIPSIIDDLQKYIAENNLLNTYHYNTDIISPMYEMICLHIYNNIKANHNRNSNAKLLTEQMF